LGNDKAQFYLGKAYETGKGVPQDYTQDAIWFRKAAEQGLADAQAELGGDYALGQGVPQDNSEAYFWLNLASAGTPATVKPEEMAALRNYVTQARDDEASLLTPEARIRVQVRVRQWLEDHPTKSQ
jgi:TPR repeat protein